MEFLFHRGAGGCDRRRMTGASSWPVMRRVSRRDAETLRGLPCGAFSPRLCASAGDGVRYRVVEFLFHRGAGGCDRRRMTGASSWPVMRRVSRRDAETLRRLLCGAFSLRLGASAGDSFRYCVAGFLLHRGAGGHGRRRRSGASFPQRR